MTDWTNPELPSRFRLWIALTDGSTVSSALLDASDSGPFDSWEQGMEGVFRDDATSFRILSREGEWMWIRSKMIKGITIHEEGSPA